MPLSGEADAYGIHVDGDDPGPGEERVAFRYAVSAGYLEATGVALLGWRTLDERDVVDADGAVLVNESFARRVVGGADAVGRRVHVGRTDLPLRTIVGIVADVKQPSLAATSSDGVYVPAAQWYFADTARWLVVRSARDVAALLPDLRRAVWSVDPGQPIVRALPLAELVATSEAQRRFARQVLDTFALLALVLAAVGLYGVVAGSVADRTREMGVRAALGAPGGRLLSMVVRQGMALVGVGVLLGLVGALAGARALGSALYGVSPTDAATYLGVVALLGATGVMACMVPAMRAARTDPARTLRAD
jgi:ABC-type antimicrobial peptide transport system permease subunit